MYSYNFLLFFDSRHYFIKPNISTVTYDLFFLSVFQLLVIDSFIFLIIHHHQQHLPTPNPLFHPLIFSIKVPFITECPTKTLHEPFLEY